MKPAPLLKYRFFDANGTPLAGGLLYSYAANTSTPLGTYSNQDGATNTNPVELDANGEADVWIDPGLSYKFELHDADDVPISTVDEVNLFVEAGQLADDAVTTDAIADEAVTEEKLADDAVTSDKIDDDAVTTSKIDDAAVTQSKRAALGQQTSTSSGTFSTASTSLVDVTNLSVSITTTGRPVFIGLISDGVGSTGYVVSDTTSGTGTSSNFCILRGAAVISTHSVGLNGAAATRHAAFVPPGGVWTIDVPAAGTYTYKVQAKCISADTAGAFYCKLIAYEL